jgi:hypothetical protein
VPLKPTQQALSILVSVFETVKFLKNSLQDPRTFQSTEEHITLFGHLVQKFKGLSFSY